MEFNLKFLTCGYNGSGCSSMLSIEYSKRYSSERFVENRFLINVGDSTQRLCSEHRIKLSKVSTIIVSSLAPHNVSGFASIFLSLSDLGVGELTVYGPSGLKAMIDVMGPLINRRYPIVKVVEVEAEISVVNGLWSKDKEELKCTSGCLKVSPIYSSKSSTKSIAIAARFDIFQDNIHHTISFIPVGYYFATYPSLTDINNWCFNISGLSCDSDTTIQRIAVFVPLAVISCPNRYSVIDLKFGKSLVPGQEILEGDNDQYSPLTEICKKFKITGFLYANELTNSCFEFRHAQRTINKLHAIAPANFPRLIYGDKLSIENKCVDTDDMTETFAIGSLQYVYPLLEMRCSIDNILGDVSFPSIKDSSFDGFEGVLANDDALVHKALDSVGVYDRGIPSYSSLSTLISSPELTNLAASFRSENSIHKPGDESMPVKWGNVGNYDAANSLRERMLSNKRKHSQTSNVVGEHNVCSSEEDVATPIGKPVILDSEKGDREPLLKRMQRKPSYGNSTTYPWSPKADGALEDSLNDPLDRCTNTAEDVLEIYFLGTGCASPSKHRSNSCIMLCLKALKTQETLCPPTISEDVPLLQLSHSPLLPPPPSLIVPGKVNRNSPIGFEGERCVSNNPKQIDNPLASMNGGPTQTKIVGTKSNPPPSLDLGLCIGEPQKVSSRRPSSGLSLDLTLCDVIGATTNSISSVNASSSSIDDCSRPIILLDVGEGTASQLFQLVHGDLNRYDDYLLRIRVIWISHHHADHTTGLLMLLQQISRAQMRYSKNQSKTSRNNDNCKDFSPAAPPSLPSLISKYDLRRNRYGGASPGYELNKIMLIASDQLLQFYEYAAASAGLEELLTFNSISNSLYAGMTGEIRCATGGALKRLQSVPVHHCQNAFGVVLELGSGEKVVYSGDCRPSQSLVKCGMNCDLLIHEATFSDDRVEHATKKRHCTFSEAVDIGKRMAAKQVILTHFSQRYPLTIGSNNNTTSVQSDQSLSISNPPSVGSAGNVFNTSNSNNAFRRGSKSNIFNTSPRNQSQGSLGVSGIGNDQENSTLDSRSVDNCENSALSNCNVSLAFDFLGCSFPSQIVSLSAVTSLVAQVLSAMEESEVADD